MHANEADDARPLDRRALLARAAAVAAVAGIRLSPFAFVAGVRARVAEAGPDPSSARTLSLAEWMTLAAVQETLWPKGEGVPGAADVHATAYLDAALSDPDVPPRDLRVVRAGLAPLSALAKERGAGGFETLDAASRESVLVAWRERAEGAEWIRTLLRYTLEAVLGDPVYGGNVGEAGWHWFGFVPADPRPQPKVAAPQRGGGAPR